GPASSTAATALTMSARSGVVDLPPNQSTTEGYPPAQRLCASGCNGERIALHPVTLEAPVVGAHAHCHVAACLLRRPVQLRSSRLGRADRRPDGVAHGADAQLVDGDGGALLAALACCQPRERVRAGLQHRGELAPAGAGHGSLLE